LLNQGVFCNLLIS